MNVEASVTVESNLPLRFHAAHEPTTVPKVNAMIWVTPTSTMVHMNFCAIRWLTL